MKIFRNAKARIHMHCTVAMPPCRSKFANADSAIRKGRDSVALTSQSASQNNSCPT